MATQLLNKLCVMASMLKKAQINLKKGPKEKHTKGYIEARIKTIEDYWKRFLIAHTELVEITTSDSRSSFPYFEKEEFDITEETYLCTVGDLNDMLEALEDKHKNNSFVSIHGNCNENQSVSALAKLPKIKLPTFSGKYEEWPAFQDMFVSLIHSNPSIANIHKLHYLRSTVEGEAEVLLRHIPVTDSNYDRAWELLQTRYNNRRLIVNSLLSRLFTQNKVHVQTSAKIKGLLDTTTECLNCLKNLNIVTDNWDPMIIHIIVQKLDPDTQKEWEEESYKANAKQLSTWEELRTFLEKRFRTLELIPTVTKEKISVSTYHAAKFLKTKEAIKVAKHCLKCERDHELTQCNEFSRLQAEERFNFVKHNHLCFNCLQACHPAYRCTLQANCRVCRRKHNTLLHQEDTNEDIRVMHHQLNLDTNQCLRNMSNKNVLKSKLTTNKNYCRSPIKNTTRAENVYNRIKLNTKRDALGTTKEENYKENMRCYQIQKKIKNLRYHGATRGFRCTWYRRRQFEASP